MGWYLTKGWYDQDEGIDAVLIHYTWSPYGQGPDWGVRHECRSLVDVGGDPRGRRKVLTMPTAVWNEGAGRWDHDFLLHYYFEVSQHGGRWGTELFSEEIVSQELEFYDADGMITNLCIHWSVDSWEAPVYSPMEEPRFPHDSEFASVRYYAYQDKPRFHEAKFHMLAQIPSPHRWRGRMWGPRGARLLQQYHVGRTYGDHQGEYFLGPDGPTEACGAAWVHEL